MTHVKALEPGQSSQGTSEPITPASIVRGIPEPITLDSALLSIKFPVYGESAVVVGAEKCNFDITLLEVHEMSWCIITV